MRARTALGVLALCAACAACAAGTARRRVPFHAVRDADFVGEDPVVARALARRAPRGTLAPWRPPSAAELGRLPLLPPPPAPDAPQARRWTRTNKTFPADPSLENVHAIQLRNMEQAIYSTQYRIMELEDILQEQQDDPRFRIAYLFKRLDEWCRDARVYYEYATRSVAPDRWLTENFVIRRHVVYYSYILRRNVDVTYTIDYLLQMHELMIKRTKTMNAEFDLMSLKENS